MAPVDGWYPDPAGMPQLRFWDGQNWTTATAPAPVTQPYAPQPHAPQLSTPQLSTPQPQAPKRGKSFYGIIAGVVAVAVGVAIVIPLASGSSHHAPPTTAALKGVLLPVADVSETTTLPFTVDDSSDDNSDDTADNTSNCVPLNNVQKAETAAQTADADQSYVSKQAGLEVDEDIAYLPGKAAALLTASQSAFEQCPTYKDGDGDAANVTFLPGLSVKGSDQVMAIQQTGTISGTPMVFDTMQARFGDTVITINYGGTKAPQDLNLIAAKLLQQAAANAKPVL